MRLYAAGNPIFDFFAFLPPRERDRLRRRFSLPDSGAHHLEQEELDALLSTAAHGPPVPGGGAFNAARIYAQLGGSAAFFGAVGGDGLPFHRELLRLDAGDHLADLVHTRSGRSLSLLSPGRPPLILVCPGAAAALTPSAVGDAFLSPPADSGEGEEPGLLYIEGFLLPRRPLLGRLLEQANTRGLPIALDLGAAAIAARHCRYITGELLPRCRWLFGTGEEMAALEEEPRSLPARYGLEAAVVKRGGAGCEIHTAGGQLSCGPFPAQEREGSGSGDLFAGAFLAALNRGLSLSEAARAAVFAGARAVELPGGRLGPKIIAKVERLLHTGDNTS